MKAAVIAGSRSLNIIEAPPPRPAADEVRVRVEGCGVCASNLPVWEGRPWFNYPLDAGSPGHEGWGYADGIGRVTFISYHAYAEYDVANVETLVRIPDDVEMFPGEAFGCAMNIFRRSDIGKGNSVAIVGAGFLGNLLIQLAKSAGARVIAISRRDSALEIARACGADETVPMRDHQEIVRRVRDFTGGRGAERVIECVGAQWPLDIANDVIGERGGLVIAGYHQDGPRQVNMQNWNWLGIDVINAHERDPKNYVRGIREAVEAVQSGRINPDLVLTNAYPLDQLDRALNDVAERPDGFVKAMVTL
jgi:threonine dehydrogenase-like Zn-dependent dehydrogenase